MLTVLQAVLAATVAAGYFVVAVAVVPRIKLDEGSPRFARAIRLGATIFFVGCGLTHTHILVHAVQGTGEAVELHEVLFHLAQVGGVWVFALAAVRVLDVRIERRKTEEEQLREENERLARSNADLDQFAYVVSHDLQEPLRTIDGYAGLLQRRAGDVDDPLSAESLASIRTAAARMSQMLDGVLAYSRVAGSGLARERVDLDEVMEEVQAQLGRRLAEADATVVVGDLPVVWGDRTQLTQLLLNLVGNAVKFAHPDRAPVVRVTAAPDEQGWTIDVRDNGLGLTPDEAGRVFEMFARAHPEREGTGIGLAVCQKIAARHGGRLWHEPADGGGSVFRVSLPQRVGALAPAAV